MLELLLGTATLSATLRLATPIALAAVGGSVSERSGVINLGLEGMMLAGAFAGAYGSFVTGSPWAGVAMAVAAGALAGGLLGLFAVKLQADHVVSGVGLNILALGLTTWLMQVIWESRGTSAAVVGLRQISVPVLRDIPVLGPVVGAHSPLVYLTPVIVLAAWVMLFRTPLGLRVRMVGEHPEAADAVGIDVPRLQLVCVALSGALAGLGGAYLSLGQLNWFSQNMSAGRGFMALAANIFGRWNPLGAAAASLLFAYTDALQMQLQAEQLGIASEFIQSLPYLLTVAVLAGGVIRSRPPAALGRHYVPGGGARASGAAP